MSRDSHELQLFRIIPFLSLEFCRSRRASIDRVQNLDLGADQWQEPAGLCSSLGCVSLQQALGWAADFCVCTCKGQTLRRWSSAQVSHLWICVDLCQEGCTAVFSCMFNEQHTVLPELPLHSCSELLAGLLQSCLTGPQHCKMQEMWS